MALNEIYTSSNDVRMIESNPLNWEVNDEKEEKYCIHIIQERGSIGCYFNGTELTLGMTISGEGGSMTFKVESLEDASNIVNKLAVGEDNDLEGTIYTSR